MKLSICILFSLVLAPVAQSVSAGADIVDFDSNLWTKVGAQVVDHLGRKSLMGNAYLTGVEFENGVIEVDIAVTGARSYPGIVFRAWSQGDYEHVYIRPHRAGLYPDAIQYAPKIKGVSSWQLCNGDGYTAGATFPENEWMHVKLEVKGTHARLFIGDTDSPALAIDHLQHGLKKGAIGLEGPPDGTAYFSNFRYETRDDLVFDRSSFVHTPPGTITEWEISAAKKVSDINTESYPNADVLAKTKWQKVECEPDGLVNVARYLTRIGREPDCVIARTVIKSDRDETRKYLFGYSDAVSVFLNGNILFAGESAYQQRDPSFLGIVGLFDAVYLPLVRGDNELLLIVTESFGGWGFICRDPEVVFTDASLEKAWETSDEFLFPESAVYDPEREVLYVSNFDAYNRANPTGGQFISTLGIDGNLIKREWVKGLRLPTGMVVVGGSLFVVERTGLAEIDIAKGEVKNRYPFPQPRFPNDVAADATGTLYVSDSNKNVIYRFTDGAYDEWLGEPDILNPNGLCVHAGGLIVGSTGDHSLKRVDLNTKAIALIARLGEGIIDGIKVDKQGDFIVSHGEGRVMRVTREGDVTILLDTTGPGRYTADFDLIAEKNLLVIPTFVDNRVVAFGLE